MGNCCCAPHAVKHFVVRGPGNTHVTMTHRRNRRTPSELTYEFVIAGPPSFDALSATVAMVQRDPRRCIANTTSDGCIGRCLAEIRFHSSSCRKHSLGARPIDRLNDVGANAVVNACMAHVVAAGRRFDLTRFTLVVVTKTKPPQPASAAKTAAASSLSDTDSRGQTSPSFTTVAHSN